MKTLIIDATGRAEAESKTKFLATRVISKLELDDAQIVDLYNMEVPFLTTEIIKTWSDSKVDSQALKLLKQFEATDQYIFIYPTWNWSVPAILKAYMDLILISGRTFGYNNRGKQCGYLKNKRAILISTTGGKSYPPILATLFRAQDGNNYMMQMLKTMGITKIKKYCIDNTAYQYNDVSGEFSKKKFEEKVNKITKII